MELTCVMCFCMLVSCSSTMMRLESACMSCRSSSYCTEAKAEGVSAAHRHSSAHSNQLRKEWCSQVHFKVGEPDRAGPKIDS